MKIINISKLCFLFSVILFSCKNTNTFDNDCIEFSEKSNVTNYKLLLFINKQENNKCTYALASNYLDDSIERKFRFDGVNGFVQLAPSKTFELLFSFKNKINSISTIKIKHRNWSANLGNEFITKSYNAILLKKITTTEDNFAIVKIERLISAFPDMGTMDGILIFSSKRGFIGSYYQSNKNPLEIYQKSGDILDKLIDYTNYDFRRIN